MQRSFPRLLFVAIAAALSGQAAAEIAIDVIHGSEVSLEGLVQSDANWFDNDVADLNGSAGNNGANSEFEMRRAEIVLKGKGVEFDWVAGYDAKIDKWLDVNLKWKQGANFFIAGQYKQPNSLEELSSTRNNDFIAKAMTTNTFGIARRTAVGYGGDHGNWGFLASAFSRELTRNLGHGDGFGGRFYYAPVQASGRVLHFGVSALDYDTRADQQRWRARPDADLATVRLVDTGTLAGARQNRTYGLEGMWVDGPLKVQGEYMAQRTARRAAADFNASSWYLSGLWNLSGETWGYKGGVPTTGLPDNPARGMGQRGLRYDAIDLDDGAVQGGREHNLTFGANWYLRSNFKLMFNYVAVNSRKFSAAAAARVADDPGIVETRLQFFW